MKILEKIKPNHSERKQFKLVSESFIKKLNSGLQDAKAVLGGSGAKDKP
jgi:tRNA nucleotidyltransferase (CCA-adding enzyme)